MSHTLGKFCNDVIPVPEITRIEVIDETGRAYVRYLSQPVLQISVQDDGRTMKVFIQENIDPDIDNRVQEREDDDYYSPII